MEDANSHRSAVNNSQNMKRSTRVSQLPSHLSDYEMFHDSTITSEGELVHFALIAQSKPVDFEKAMTNEK